MEESNFVAIGFFITKSYRKNAVIPGKFDTSNIEITFQRVEEKVVVHKPPSPVFRITINYYPVRLQIWYVDKCIVAVRIVYIECHTGHTPANINNTGWYLITSQGLFCFQIDYPNGWTLNNYQVICLREMFYILNQCHWKMFRHLLGYSSIPVSANQSLSQRSTLIL